MNGNHDHSRVVDKRLLYSPNFQIMSFSCRVARCDIKSAVIVIAIMTLTVPDLVGLLLAFIILFVLLINLSKCCCPSNDEDWPESEFIHEPRRCSQESNDYVPRPTEWDSYYLPPNYVNYDDGLFSDEMTARSAGPFYINIPNETFNQLPPSYSEIFGDDGAESASSDNTQTTTRLEIHRDVKNAN